MAADPKAPLALVWGIAFFAGSLAQLAARFSVVPAVVLLLATGLLIGHAGLDWIQPDQLARGPGLALPLALVFGAIALATGPTVVNPLVRQIGLSPFLARVLEAEELLLETPEKSCW